MCKTITKQINCVERVVRIGLEFTLLIKEFQLCVKRLLLPLIQAVRLTAQHLKENIIEVKMPRYNQQPWFVSNENIAN